MQAKKTKKEILKEKKKKIKENKGEILKKWQQ